MKHKNIILLAGNGDSTNIIFNDIHKSYGISLAIIEEKESTKIFLKRRIKKLGILKVLGQVAFQVLIAKPLSFLSKKRLQEIMDDHNLDASEIPDNQLKRVASVNSNETISLIQSINPDLIIVNGTRIISKKVIAAINCRLINTHAGITPKYRGVHGTYWALANNDIENSGVTVHFVDEGIDTGNIIYQAQVIPGKKDNFITYPMLQLAAGLNILHKSIEDYFTGRVEIKQGSRESFLWYHPTLWNYIYNRVIRKVK